MKATCKQCGIDEPDHRADCHHGLFARLAMTAAVVRDQEDAIRRLRAELQRTASLLEEAERVRDADRRTYEKDWKALQAECLRLQEWDQKRVLEMKSLEERAERAEAALKRIYARMEADAEANGTDWVDS